jgi:hypothetical protein
MVVSCRIGPQATLCYQLKEPGISHVPECEGVERCDLSGAVLNVMHWELYLPRSQLSCKR